ncbi:hypothetical protein BGZ63DRAFT_95758 [Mariannaea sp. PMI_226]|nr:hypothetical protein BGZ63DRAFT_95758 [Mariannaea sp. PMI_226]
MELSPVSKESSYSSKPYMSESSGKSSKELHRHGSEIETNNGPLSPGSYHYLSHKKRKRSVMAIDIGNLTQPKSRRTAYRLTPSVETIVEVETEQRPLDNQTISTRVRCLNNEASDPGSLVSQTSSKGHASEIRTKHAPRPRRVRLCDNIYSEYQHRE